MLSAMPARAYAPYPQLASNPIGVGDVGVGATICEKRNTLKARKARQGGRLSPADETELARIRAKIKRTGHSCGGPFDDVVGAVTSVVTAPVKAAGAIVSGKNVVKAVTDVVTSPVKAYAAATSSIPVFGDMTRIVSNASSAPLNLANAIASGARIDRAVVAHLKAALKNVKEAAPYAQMVVSIVPGVGPGVSAAIGAGVALAEGKTIDEIAKAAIRGAIPGGPLAVAAFDTALKVASGANVAQSVLEGARAQLPAAAQKAFDIGLAVVTGEKIQTALANGLMSLAPDQVRMLLDAGQKALGATPALSNAIKGIASGAGQEGFKLAAGLMSQAGISEKALVAVRKQLSADKLSGFDAALKTGNVAWLQNITAPTVRSAPPSLHAIPVVRKPLQALKAVPVVRKPLPALKAVSKPAAPTPIKIATTPTAVAPTASTPAPAAATQGKYAPYPSNMTGTAGVGAFWGSDSKWRWFTARDRRGPAVNRGPVWLSDQEALQEEAGLIESAQRHGNIGDVTRWDWDGRQWHQARGGVLSAPPGGGHGRGGGPGRGGRGHGGGRPFGRTFAKGGWGWQAPWWGAPWSPEVVTTVETCRTWGDPIPDLPAAMQQAAQMALGASKGRPTTVRGPDNVLYLFAFENGTMTARPCAAVATG